MQAFTPQSRSGSSGTAAGMVLTMRDQPDASAGAPEAMVHGCAPTKASAGSGPTKFRNHHLEGWPAKQSSRETVIKARTGAKLSG